MELLATQKEAVQQTLRITEIFYSLQGESTFVGMPTVFVRLTGCPLRCQYCDTAYAFSGGEKRSLEEIVSQVTSFFSPSTPPEQCYVTVTGGEPLAQPNCFPLLTLLCEKGYCVSLETSGAIDVAKVDPRVIKVVDIKTPASKECDKNIYKNFDYLTRHDQIKFVICDRTDYEWSKQCVQQHGLLRLATVLFSPSYQQVQARQLADWIVEDKLPVRFQMQLHKLLWDDEAGR